MVDVIINDMFGRDSKRFSKYLVNMVNYDITIKTNITKNFAKIQLPEDSQKRVLINATCKLNIYDTKLEDILTMPKEKLRYIYVIVSPYFAFDYKCITAVDKDVVAKLTDDVMNLAWLDIIALNNFIGDMEHVEIVLTGLLPITKTENIDDINVCDEYWIKQTKSSCDRMPEPRLDLDEIRPFYTGFKIWNSLDCKCEELNRYCEFLRKATKKNIHREVSFNQTETKWDMLY